MVGLILTMIFVPAVAHSCANMVLYVSTTHVSLRLGYSFKSGIENVQKIKRDIAAMNLNEENFEEENSTDELG